MATTQDFEEAKNEIGAAIYRKFTRFTAINADFQSSNPQATVLPYTECKFLGLERYVIYVRGVTHFTSDVLDAVRAHFSNNDVRAVVDTQRGTGEFSVPVEAVVEFQPLPSRARRFFEELTEPRVLLLILLSLLVLFVSMFWLLRVPESDKSRVVGHAGGWLVSWLPFSSGGVSAAPMPARKSSAAAASQVPTDGGGAAAVPAKA